MTQVIFKNKKRAVIAGLEWSVLGHYQAKNSITPEVRAYATAHGADRIIVHVANVDGVVHATVGTTSMGELDESVGSEQHALGALFARSHAENANMVLAWCFEKIATLVVVQNGLPVVDQVLPIENVGDYLEKVVDGLFGARGHAIYSNDTSVHPFAEMISEGDLWAAATKSTRLGKIPFKKLAIAGMLVAFAVVFGGFHHYQQLQADAKLAATQATLAAEDPLPSYQAALAASIGNLGFDRASIKLTLLQLEHYDVWPDGWILRQIDCDMARCTSTWDRMGGTTKSLIAALPHETYLPEESSEEVSIFAWPSQLKPSGYTSTANLEVEESAKADSRNAYQVWRNAGLLVQEQTKEFAVWPTPPSGNASLLPRAASVLARPVSVTARYPFVQDLIDLTPAAVWWQSFSISFTPGGKADQLKITLKGTSYVR